MYDIFIDNIKDYNKEDYYIQGSNPILQEKFFSWIVVLE